MQCSTILRFILLYSDCFLCYSILFYRSLHYAFIPSLPFYFITVLFTRVCGLRLCVNVTVAHACTSAGSGANCIFCPPFFLYMLSAHRNATRSCNSLVTDLGTINIIDLTAPLEALEGPQGICHSRFSSVGCFAPPPTAV